MRQHTRSSSNDAALAAAMAGWARERERVCAQLAKLQQALREQGGALELDLAARGLPAFIERLRAGLRSAADTTALRHRLAGDPVLPMLESNPYGILVNIGDPLDTALAAIEAALSQQAGSMKGMSDGQGAQ